MKNILQYSLIAAIILGLGTTQARAGDDEAIAAIGGFVAGIITGAVLDDDDHYRGERHVVYHDSYYKPGRHHPRRDRYDYRSGHHPRGHWEIRRVRVWVPGYWEIAYNRCGERIRLWKSGHHVWKKNRVWIPHRGRGSHDRHWD